MPTLRLRLLDKCVGDMTLCPCVMSGTSYPMLICPPDNASLTDVSRPCGGWHYAEGVEVRSAARHTLMRSMRRVMDDFPTLIKKKINVSLSKRKFRMEQLQSYIWLTASSYMGKYLHISSYIRKPFLIYDFSTDPIWISLNMRKISFSFLSV